MSVQAQKQLDAHPANTSSLCLQRRACAHSSSPSAFARHHDKRQPARWPIAFIKQLKDSDQSLTQSTHDA
eukprot:704915-Pleurochrysis_carterae.AAC.1